MKRGRPLKRSELKRGRELRADVERVREFLRKGRGQLGRSEIRSKPRRRQVGEGPLTPAQWRARVFESSGGRCIISGAEARDAEDRRFHAHHVLPKRVLRARGLRAFVWDPRNGVLLHRDVHERHENAAQRVPRSALPAAVWAFARELDALDGTEWATQLLLRLYPAR